MIMENKVTEREVDTLTKICQTLILKYTHHIVWRRLDPPNANWPEEFKPHRFSLPNDFLPNDTQDEEKNPDRFRKNLKLVREYFSSNLVRPVYNSLSEECVKLVTNNVLKHGDIILQLVFQDELSRKLIMNAKHVVYRRWSIREERTLQRYLTNSSHNLICIKLPGKADDKVVNVIAQNCKNLEELDISHSCLTDQSLMALAGVSIFMMNRSCGSNDNDTCVKERGSYDRHTGKFVRAAASKAIRDIRSLCANQQQNNFLQELAQGTSAFNTLKENFPQIEEKTKPMIEKRTNPNFRFVWSVANKRYSFDKNLGCLKLRSLDIWSTNYPKSIITRKGDMVSNLGVTKEAVLCVAILLSKLTTLKYNDLGDVLQLLHYVFKENDFPKPELDLTYFSETRLTLDKLSVARRLCPNISSLDISMFNFSFFDPEATSSFATDSMNKYSESSKLLFEFSKLKDLEIQYMDDSKIFHSCLKDSASNLTRLCLNKMISISFESLAAIKKHCQKLEVLDVYVDEVTTFLEHTPVGQVVAETENTHWESLKSLKLGGSIPDGSVLEYLIESCPNLKVLCYSLYEGSCDSITDHFIENLFEKNPMPKLTAFYCEKSMLSISTFYYLVNRLPKLKYVGVLSEWGGLDRAGIIAIKAYVLGNNLNIDIESMQDQYYL